MADMFCVSVTSESVLLLHQEEQQESLANVHQRVPALGQAQVCAN